MMRSSAVIQRRVGGTRGVAEKAMRKHSGVPVARRRNSQCVADATDHFDLSTTSEDEAEAEHVAALAPPMRSRTRRASVGGGNRAEKAISGVPRHRRMNRGRSDLIASDDDDGHAFDGIGKDMRPTKSHSGVPISRRVAEGWTAFDVDMDDGEDEDEARKVAALAPRPRTSRARRHTTAGSAERAARGNSGVPRRRRRNRRRSATEAERGQSHRNVEGPVKDTASSAGAFAGVKIAMAKEKNRLDILALEEVPRPDDSVARAALDQAIAAATKGTYGVGAVLVGPGGEIAVEGHNEVHLAGAFRSDLHAEMVVLNRFEESRRGQPPESLPPPSTYTLVTSLEPCPMCLTRAIFSGIGRICWVCDDDIGGMARRMENMPPVFQDLFKKQGQQVARADCHPEMRRAAFRIWDNTRAALDAAVVERSGGAAIDDGSSAGATPPGRGSSAAGDGADGEAAPQEARGGHVPEIGRKILMGM